jgi:hypothetical protein
MSSLAFMAYILMPDKEESSFCKMFDLLLNDYSSNELPANFCHDFEKSALNAIQSRIKDVNVYGCMEKSSIEKPEKWVHT